MRTKKGLELRQINSKSYILESVESGLSLQKMITFNTTAAFLWKSIKDSNFEQEDLASLLQEKYSISTDMAMEDSKFIIQEWIRANIIELV
jgi:hypothetical protein